VEFDRYLATAVEKVKKALGGGGVVILVPPGSARGEVTKRLVHEGIVGEDDVVLYEDLHRRVGVGRPLRRVGTQLYVGEEPLLHYLKHGVVLGPALRQRKVVIVPRDTAEALLIYETLLKELRKEKTYSVENVEKLVKTRFLPALYQEGDKEVAELAEVDYGDVLKVVVENASGISPSLARLAKEAKAGGSLEELRQRMELLRSLYTGSAVPSLLAIAKEAAASAAKSTGLSWASSVATGAVLSHVLTALASLNPLETLASQFFGEFIEGVLDRVLSRLKKRKDEALATVIEVIKRAAVAKPLVEEAVRGEGVAGEAATLEALVDWAAVSWGLTMQEFATVVHNLATLLEDKVSTHRDVEELKKKLEAKWAELEKRVEKLEKRKEAQEVDVLSKIKLPKVSSTPELAKVSLTLEYRVKEGSPRRDRRRGLRLAG